MKRELLTFGILGVIGAAVLVALWTLRIPSAGRSNHDSLKETVESAVTGPVAFARSRFTGGIGAIMLVDPKTGVPVIHHGHGWLASRSGRFTRWRRCPEGERCCDEWTKAGAGRGQYQRFYRGWGHANYPAHWIDES